MPTPTTDSSLGKARQRQSLTVRCLGVAVLWASLWALPAAWAKSSQDDDFVVIVHADNPLTSTTRDYLSDVFLKRMARWPGGGAILPADLHADSVVRHAFSEDVLQRSVIAVRRYWQQRIFSGRELPPPEFESEQAIVEYVESTPGSIGYVSAAAKLTRARVIQVR
jgi:hypothetical protein